MIKSSTKSPYYHWRLKTLNIYRLNNNNHFNITQHVINQEIIVTKHFLKKNNMHSKFILNKYNLDCKTDIF